MDFQSEGHAFDDGTLDVLAGGHALAEQLMVLCVLLKEVQGVLAGE